MSQSDPVAALFSGNFSQEIEEIENEAHELVEEIQCVKEQHYSEFFRWKMERFGHALSQSSIDNLLYEKLAARKEIKELMKDDERVVEVMSKWGGVVEANKVLGETIQALLKKCAALPEGEMVYVNVLLGIKKRNKEEGWHQQLSMMRVWPAVYAWALAVNVQAHFHKRAPEQQVLGKRWVCYGELLDQTKWIKSMLEDEIRSWGAGTFLFQDKTMANGQIWKRHEQKDLYLGWLIKESDKIAWWTAASEVAMSLTEGKRSQGHHDDIESRMVARVMSSTEDIVTEKIKSTVSQAAQAAREEVEKLTTTIDSNVKRAVSEMWDAEGERREEFKTRVLGEVRTELTDEARVKSEELDKRTCSGDGCSDGHPG